MAPVNTLAKLFLAQLKDMTLPGTWTQGVKLYQSKEVFPSLSSPQESTFKVRASVHLFVQVALYVTDQDFTCTCKDKASPCAHVVAAAIALNHQNAQPQEKSHKFFLRYILHWDQQSIRLKRTFATEPHSLAQDVPLQGSLMQHATAQTGQRTPLSGPELKDIPLTSLDLATDAFQDVLELQAMLRLLRILKDLNLEPFRLVISTSEKQFFPVIGIKATPVQVPMKIVQQEGSHLWTFEPAWDAPPKKLDRVSQLAAFENPKDKESCTIRCITMRAVQLNRKVLAPQRPETWDPSLKTLYELIENGDLTDPEGFLRAFKLKDPTIVLSLVTHSNGWAVLPGFQTHTSAREMEDPGARKRLAAELKEVWGLTVGLSTPFSLAKLQELVPQWEKATTSLPLKLDSGLRELIDKPQTIVKLHQQLNQKLRASVQIKGQELFLDWDALIDRISIGAQTIQLFDKTHAFIDDTTRETIKTILSLVPQTSSQHKSPSHAPILTESLVRVLQRENTVFDREQFFNVLKKSNIPTDIQTTLRPYQKEGFEFLFAMKQLQQGVILADEMGLGKTLQLLCALDPLENTLIVAPTSVLSAWGSQIMQFRPSLTPFFYNSGQKIDSEMHLVIVSYTMLRIHQAHFGAITWDWVIFDEAQIIKNPAAQISQICQALPKKAAIAVTGTPIENRIEDLLCLWKTVCPHKTDGQLSNIADLQKAIKPHLIRRLKKDVLTELPEKIELTCLIELNEAHRKFYQDLQTTLRSESKGKMSIFQALLRLRQAACDSRLISPEFGLHDSKIQFFQEKLLDAFEANHSCLVFSQWTKFLDLIEQALDKLHLPFSRIDGSTKNRGTIIDAFQAAATPQIMLLSTKACGFGITLTKADQVFILDPWWNPAVESQAIDRTHRIGQKSCVTVMRLIAKDTVEEKIAHLLAQKKHLFEKVLDEDHMQAMFPIEELFDICFKA